MNFISFARSFDIKDREWVAGRQANRNPNFQYFVLFLLSLATSVFFLLLSASYRRRSTETLTERLVYRQPGALANTCSKRKLNGVEAAPQTEMYPVPSTVYEYYCIQVAADISTGQPVPQPEHHLLCSFLPVGPHFTSAPPMTTTEPVVT
jgi:hypothetical protein